MNDFLYSHCNLVPRRISNAQIEHRSAKSCSGGTLKKTTLMGVGTSLTYGCPGSVLLPLPGPLGPQVERGGSFRYNLVVLRAWRGYL